MLSTLNQVRVRIRFRVRVRVTRLLGFLCFPLSTISGVSGKPFSSNATGRVCPAAIAASRASRSSFLLSCNLGAVVVSAPTAVELDALVLARLVGGAAVVSS